MSEYKGSPAFGEMQCQRCGAPVKGMYWARFTANGALVGDVCDRCRCEVMADYIIPCAYHAHGDDWAYSDASSVGDRLRRAAETLRLERKDLKA